MCCEERERRQSAPSLNLVQSLHRVLELCGDAVLQCPDFGLDVSDRPSRKSDAVSESKGFHGIA